MQSATRPYILQQAVWMPAGRAVLPQLTAAAQVLRLPFQAHWSRHKCTCSVKGSTLALEASPLGDRALGSSRQPLLMHAAGAQEHATTDTPEGATGKLTPRGNALPPVVHAKASATGRIIVVGDIHGCLEEFRALLAKCGFRHGDDTLVLVGDLVNKGPHSAAVVAEARRLGALAVRGNHDDAALAAFAEHKSGRARKNKHYWVDGLTAEDAAWLGRLPFTLRLRDTTLVVHAGMVPGVPRKKQKLQDLYTMRDVKRRKSGGWKAEEEHAKGGTLWAEVWRGPRHVFFGHDAQRRMQLRKFATGLDTGCCYGGELTACVIPAASKGGPLIRLVGWLRRCLGARSSKGRALTLHQLGGKIVAVPSRQSANR